MDALGSAVLIKEIEGEKAVAAVVSREEVRRALDDRDASAELVLEVVWKDARGEREHDTIRIDWSRQDLENLLARATDDRVVLTFDRAQLEEALGDVEAHGLRERAVVFAVAATGVLAAGAGVGHAAPTLTDVSSTGGYAASPAATFMTDASSAGGYVAQAAAEDQMVSDASSAGGYVAPAPSADSLLTDVSSAGGYAASDAAVDASSLVTDASSGGGYVAPSPPSAADGGITFNALNPTTDGAIAGAFVLTIAAAAFVSRRRRPEGVA